MHTSRLRIFLSSARPFSPRVAVNSPPRFFCSLHRASTMATPSPSTSRVKPPATQDSWRQPLPSPDQPTLRVYNSLTRTKVDFVTKKPGVVTWYNCGPTVYDSSHMGHARNYLTQDIMRRILRDYFGYEVHFVMNITDVDDKIILRARQSHLLKAFLSTATSSPTPLSSNFLSEVESAWTAHFYKTLGGSTPDTLVLDEAVLKWKAIEERAAKDLAWVEEQKTKEEKWGMHFTAVKGGLEGIETAKKQVEAKKTGQEEASALVESNTDALGLWLDKKLGHTVTDPAIFRDLAAFWETSFFDSMSALHVERPTTMTRVSEYLPEIVKFVEKIVERGFAYADASGNVWFNTAKFEGSEGEEEWKHTYAKLQPWSKGNKELLEDGEGSLTASSGKKASSDFALWKSSKPGEPQWPSPWGEGRPGWHIECSVMASAVLGEGMDVHSGGVDLAFPHHDNEIAQSEAHHNCRQWVNYFLHTGHLHIEGLKMSKSLKNFITIDDALTRFSARQLRFSFLLTTWNARFDFKEAAMQEVKASENMLNNYFANTSAVLAEAKRNEAASDGQHHYEEAEIELMAKLEKAQLDFRTALCDSFDTPKALQTLLDLVSANNTYVGRGRERVNVPVLVANAEWVTRMLRMFGMGEGSPTDSTGNRVIGWGLPAVAGQEASVDRESTLMPYLTKLSEFRDSVRKLALEGAAASQYLALSDKLRDDLGDLGVALDDQNASKEDGRALVKLVPAEMIRQAREEKAAKEREARAKKAALAEAAETKRKEKLEKGRTPPTELFKTAEYSAWDEKGIPTKDKEGVDVAKSKAKKLAKEWDIQKKLHDEFLKATE